MYIKQGGWDRKKNKTNRNERQSLSLQNHQYARSNLYFGLTICKTAYNYTTKR